MEDDARCGRRAPTAARVRWILNAREGWDELRLSRARHPHRLASYYMAGKSLDTVPTPMLKAWGKYHIPGPRRRPSVSLR